MFNASCKTPNSSSEIKPCIKDKSNISSTCLRLAVVKKKVKKSSTYDGQTLLCLHFDWSPHPSCVVQLDVNRGTRNSRFPQDFSSHYHRRRHSTFLVLTVPIATMVRHKLKLELAGEISFLSFYSGVLSTLLLNLSFLI